MSEPVRTRNFGNEVQPQSSATQTPVALKQQEETDYRQSTAERARPNSRTNGYYPSQRSITHDHQKKHDEDPRDPHISRRYDQQRSTTHRSRSPSPPLDHGSTTANDRYRTPSPSDHHR